MDEIKSDKTPTPVNPSEYLYHKSIGLAEAYSESLKTKSPFLRSQLKEAYARGLRDSITTLQRAEVEAEMENSDETE